ncbi:Protein RTM1 [Rhodotorula toruloides]|nr:Protein RTM1 [Rhodotorula toruloides]
MAAGDDWTYYAYRPRYDLAYMGIGLFAAAFVVQLFLTMKRRTWYMIPFVIAMIGECLGYVFRRVSADHLRGRGAALTWYLLQERVAHKLFLILSPALMCASYCAFRRFLSCFHLTLIALASLALCDSREQTVRPASLLDVARESRANLPLSLPAVCFGRIITYVGERWTPVSSKWVTFIFVTQDIVSFVVQGAGGSLYSSDNTKIYPAAKAILCVGFCIQIIGLGIFAIFAGIYHTRARRAGVPAGPWSHCLFTLYAGSVCVLVRGVFRTIEFGTGSGGGQGYLLSREGYFYGLEFGPIVIAALIFCVSYPGYYVPHARSARLFPEQEVAQEGLEAGPSASGSEVEGEKALEGGEGEKRRWWTRRA